MPQLLASSLILPIRTRSSVTPGRDGVAVILRKHNFGGNWQCVQTNVETKRERVIGSVQWEWHSNITPAHVLQNEDMRRLHVSLGGWIKFASSFGLSTNLDHLFRQATNYDGQSLTSWAAAKGLDLEVRLESALDAKALESFILGSVPVGLALCESRGRCALVLVWVSWHECHQTRGRGQRGRPRSALLWHRPPLLGCRGVCVHGPP